jgi:hypothetical protein
MSWYRVPLWDLRPDIISCWNVAVWNLRSCIYWAPSLTRGRVCISQCPSRSEPETILYCLIWDSPNLEGQVPIFISPRNRVAQLYPQALGFLYVVSYDSQGYGGGILTLPLPGGKGPGLGSLHGLCIWTRFIMTGCSWVSSVSPCQIENCFCCIRFFFRFQRLAMNDPCAVPGLDCSGYV